MAGRDHIAVVVEPRVLGEPKAPMAFLIGFTDSGVGLELGFWLRDPEEGQLGAKSAINRRILSTFRENRIEIPYPRRDIHWVDPETAPGPPAGAPPIGA